MSTGERLNRPGRPRDNAIEGRVLTEAVRLFGAHGWSGFSIEKVAAATGVGKASIYLRWSSKEDLLLDGLRTHLPDVRDVDTGSFRGDLLQLAHQTLALDFGPIGRAAERLVLDSDFTEALATRLEEYRESQFTAGRKIIARAVERGEVSGAVPGNLVLNVLVGAASTYANLTPRSSRDRAHERAPVFAEQLVDFVLQGIAGTAESGQDRP